MSRQAFNASVPLIQNGAIRQSGALLAGLVSLGACADGNISKNPGRRVEVAVAALDLPEVDVACYDVAVTTATDTVWSRGNPDLAASAGDTTALCSDRFGARNSISYVGPCDADIDADTDLTRDGVQNTVTLWVDGLYTGSSATTLTPIDADGVSLWQNPCTGSGCVLDVDCVENADSPVTFNIAIMRNALQGFFDIAVNFENIFCSSKIDTCYRDENGVPTNPINLLFGPDRERDQTMVFGFACTAGAGDDNGTTLHMSGVRIVCQDGPGNEVIFNFDPTGSEGNFSVDPRWGRLVDSTVLPDVPPYELLGALYYGDESLNCAGASCNKKYWNFALNAEHLDDQGLRNCRMRVLATATGEDTDILESNGTLSPEVTAYPVITVANHTFVGENGGVPCQANALNGVDSPVVTRYASGTSRMVDGVATPAGFRSVGTALAALCNTFPPGANAPADAGYGAPHCD